MADAVPMATQPTKPRTQRIQPLPFYASGSSPHAAARLRGLPGVVLPLSNQQPQKKRPADEGCNDADWELEGRQDRPCDRVAGDEKGRAEERRRRQHESMVGSDEPPHEVRHDDANEADRAAD